MTELSATLDVIQKFWFCSDFCCRFSAARTSVVQVGSLTSAVIQMSARVVKFMRSHGVDVKLTHWWLRLLKELFKVKSQRKKST